MSCEKIKDDVLVIYPNLAKRTQKLILPTATYQAKVSVPQGLIKSSVFALFDDLDSVPVEYGFDEHDNNNNTNNLLLKLPNGYVAIEDSKGKIYEGNLESLDGSQAVIKESKTNQLKTISDYTGINFLERYKTLKVSLNYLINHITWSANHRLLISGSGNNNEIVSFITTANVKNQNGEILVPKKLYLALGTPTMLNKTNIHSFARREARAKVSGMMLQQNLVEQESSDDNSNSLNNLGIEDFSFIEIGSSQPLKAESQFEIVNIKDQPIQKYYRYPMINGSQEMSLGYRFRVDIDDFYGSISGPATNKQGLRIPPGVVSIYKYNTRTRSVEAWLGESQISQEKTNGELIDLPLGDATIVRGECFTKTREKIVNQVVKSQDVTLQGVDSQDVYLDQDYLDDDDNDDDDDNNKFESEFKSEIKTRTKISTKTRTRARATRSSQPIGNKLIINNSNVVDNGQRTKIIMTIYNCTFTNNSDETATILPVFQTPYGAEYVSSVTEDGKEPVRRKNGVIEFNTQVKPHTKKNWVVTVVTKVRFHVTPPIIYDLE